MAPARRGAQGVARAWRRGEPRPADEVRKAAGLEGEAPAGGVWLWGVAKPRGRGFRGGEREGDRESRARDGGWGYVWGVKSLDRADGCSQGQRSSRRQSGLASAERD